MVECFGACRGCCSPCSNPWYTYIGTARVHPPIRYCCDEGERMKSERLDEKEKIAMSD